MANKQSALRDFYALLCVCCRSPTSEVALLANASNLKLLLSIPKGEQNNLAAYLRPHLLTAVVCYAIQQRAQQTVYGREINHFN